MRQKEEDDEFPELIVRAEQQQGSRLVRIALDYAAEHRDAIVERIDRNRFMAERSRVVAEQRGALLA